MTLKVGRLDEIAIDDAEAPDAGANEQICRRGANRAATYDNSAGGEQTLLTLNTNPSEKHLAGVFFLESVIH